MQTVVPSAVGRRVEVGDVVSDTMALAKAHLLPAVGLNAMFTFGALVVGGGIGVASYFAFFDRDQPLVFFVAIALAVLLFAVSSLVGYVATYQYFMDALRGRSATIGSALATSLPKLPLFFVAMLISGLVMMFGMCLCFVPGFIAMLALFVVGPICIEEDVGPIQALERSNALTTGHKVDIFLLFLILWAVGMAVGIVGTIFGAIGGEIVGGGSDPIQSQLIQSAISVPIQMIFSMLITPFQFAIACVVYHRRTTDDRPQYADVAGVFS